MSFKCPDCPYVAASLIELQNHILKHSYQARNVARCEVCGFQAESVDLLFEHAKAEHGVFNAILQTNEEARFMFHNAVAQVLKK